MTRTKGIIRFLSELENDIESGFFYLKMKDGKYHIFEKVIVDVPRVRTYEYYVVDDEEMAKRYVDGLNDA